MTQTTLAVIGDVHDTLDRLDRVLGRIAEVQPDGVLLVGDLGANTLHGRWRRDPAAWSQRRQTYLMSVERVLNRLRNCRLPFAWVPGNHDLPDVPGGGNIDGKSVQIGGLRVAGIGGAGPDRFGFPYEWDEDSIRALELPPCDVILSHSPPRDTPLDRVPRAARHVGSAAIRELAEAHEGFLVCGHIHESAGAVQLGRCLCVNVGGLGEPFGRTQVVFLRRGPEGDAATWEDLEGGERRSWRRA